MSFIRFVGCLAPPSNLGTQQEAGWEPCRRTNNGTQHLGPVLGLGIGLEGLMHIPATSSTWHHNYFFLHPYCGVLMPLKRLWTSPQVGHFVPSLAPSVCENFKSSGLHPCSSTVPYPILLLHSQLGIPRNIQPRDGLKSVWTCLAKHFKGPIHIKKSWG